MKIVRYLLFPIVPIYYLVTWLRNKLYDLGIKKSVAYDFPVICVGNLNVGGTGKSPMIEYLVRMLSSQHVVATLSRGYKRETKGFIVADKNATAAQIGDEPLQFYKKYANIVVSVDADRVHGISQLMALPNPPEVILLDDAYQHRKVNAGFQILLTSYNDLYIDDIVLPTGNLREPVSGAQRADVIVVTKSPVDLSEETKKNIIRKMTPLQYQEVFFGSISYATTIQNDEREMPLESLRNNYFTLVTGIANPTPLVTYLQSLGLSFEHLLFNDHHSFSVSDITNLKEKQFILTTEKDMVRLQPYFDEEDAIFYLPIEMKMDRPEDFEKLIGSFVK